MRSGFFVVMTALVAAGAVGVGAGCDGGDGGGGADGGISFRDAALVSTGLPCDDASMCSSDLECQPEETVDLGDVDDPVEGLPDGGTGVSVVRNRDGYCGVVGTEDDPFPCIPGREQCGFGATCVRVGSVTGCFRSCTSSDEDNDVCREGYECAFEGACLSGCSSDTECRVQRQDTNGNGIRDSEDRLVYDDASDAVCDPETFRCTHGGTADAEAGIPCAADSECEADGECRVFWPGGGYCTKFGCDRAGRACAGDAVCQSRAFGVAACFQGCEVGAEVEADRLGPGGHGAGCRSNYMCLYDLEGPAGEINGACVPGNYNAVSEPNVGAACDSDAECYSPYGAGACAEGSLFGQGYCTVLDCNAPGLADQDLCGPDADCIPFAGGGSGCMAICTSASDCQPGFGCVDLDRDPATAKVCADACDTADDCRPGETCDPSSFRCTG